MGIVKPIDQIIRESEEIEAKATPGPWHNFDRVIKAENALNLKHHVPKDWNICRFSHRTADYPISHQEWEGNKELIAHSRNNLHKFRDALKAAFNYISTHPCDWEPYGNPYTGVEQAHAEECRKCLAVEEIQKILQEGE